MTELTLHPSVASLLDTLRESDRQQLKTIARVLNSSPAEKDLPTGCVLIDEIAPAAVLITILLRPGNFLYAMYVRIKESSFIFQAFVAPTSTHTITEDEMDAAQNNLHEMLG